MGVLFHSTHDHPCIDPQHLDNLEVRSGHFKATDVTTHESAPRVRFSTRQCSLTRSKGFLGLPPSNFLSSLACSILRFVTDRAHQGPFRKKSWVAL
ncbi:hypothetical protein TNCV_4619051 [Trichonephila clavipes]|nr:hypothetical protein TNCV_4619051 [Trichonephila clavipes]